MKGICINQDTQDLIGRTGRDRPSLETIKNFPKIFEGTHVTDYFINMIDTCATFPSKTRTSFLDKYYQKVENGIPVDYSSCNCCKGMHYTYEELGIDYIDLHIKGFRAAGINPWLTYRMNDYHSRNEPTSVLFSDFYHEHPEIRNGRNIPKNLWGWDGYAYDFKFEIVRKHELDIINESLERYDPYGIELDFQREMACFALGEEYEGIEIMNGFMRDVDAIVAKAEERWGHKIKIAVRVMPEINYCYEYGFDVMKWVQEGIVDTVVISARWASSDTDMPIGMWKTLLAPYGAELFAGYEYWVQPSAHSERLRPNIDIYTAYAANAFSQGADKFYLYNYYTSFDTEFDRDGEYDFDPTHTPGDSAQYFTIINHLGDPDKILTMNRRHMVLIKDRAPRWRGSEHIGDGESRGLNQLPLRFEYSGCFRLMVGDIADGATVTLRFSVDDLELALANIPRLFVNSVECEYIGNEKDERFCPYPLLCYNIPREALKTNITALISTTKLITTRYVDVFVKARN